MTTPAHSNPCFRTLPEYSGMAMEDFPLPSHSGHMPGILAQWGQCGSVEFRCGFVPVPLQTGHLPVPSQWAHWAELCIRQIMRDGRGGWKYNRMRAWALETAHNKAHVKPRFRQILRRCFC